MRFGFSNSIERNNFYLYLMGTFVSQLGSVLYTFVMSLYILKLTDSGVYFSLNLAISMIPIVFIMPLAGVLADRWDKKSIVVIMDLLSGLLLVGLYVFIYKRGITLALVYSTTFILSIFSAVFDIGFSSAKIDLVLEERLIVLNSTGDIISSLTRIIGPLVGGLLFSIIDTRTFILINGISFILSGISEVFIDFDFNKKRNTRINNKFLEDIKLGYQYIINRKDIKSILQIFIIINLALSLSVTVPLPYIINNTLKLGTKSYGIIQAGFPIGLIIGASLISRFLKRMTYEKIFKSSLLIFSILIAVFGVVLFTKDIIRLNNLSYLTYYLIVVAIMGIFISFIDIPVLTYLQTRTSPNYLGRVMGIGMSVVKVTTPLAYILSGFLLDNLEARYVVLLGSLICLIYFSNIRKTQFIKD